MNKRPAGPRFAPGQYDLYDGQPPHEEPQTSLDAALSIEGAIPSMQAQVLKYIAGRGVLGATDDEIEQALGLRHQTASARRRELVLKGFIVFAGALRETTSGRAAQVWVVSKPK